MTDREYVWSSIVDYCVNGECCLIVSASGSTIDEDISIVVDLDISRRSWRGEIRNIPGGGLKL